MLVDEWGDYCSCPDWTLTYLEMTWSLIEDATASYCLEGSRVGIVNCLEGSGGNVTTMTTASVDQERQQWQLHFNSSSGPA